MWEHDEGDAPYWLASGFIRVGVHPTWQPEFFFQVRLNRQTSPVVVWYSLPSGVKTITELLEAALKKGECSDAETLAARLPIQRRTLVVNEQMKELIDHFFKIQVTPRRIPADTVRLDGTLYEVNYVGDDQVSFSSDDDEAAMSKWVQSFVRLANPEGSR
jgi:hypothetical protein